ncbi:unnamed protein product, partial [marine sediment metagenome]
ITESTHYRCTQANYRVYIIDECHSLSPQAANALLKTLEEPPSNVVFIFCTTEPENVIKTIKSRCLVCGFKNISIKEIAERLKYICEQENITADEDALEFIARYAKGGLRDAICFLDQLSRHKQPLTMDFLKDALSLINTIDIFEFLKLIINKKESDAISKALELSFEKPLLDFMSIFIETLENIYLYKLGLFESQEKALYQQLASQLSRTAILHMVYASQSVVEKAKYFFLFSQQASIAFFVSQLFEFLDNSQATQSNVKSNLLSELLHLPPRE